MSTYVISDLHGCKKEFDTMLEKIGFTDYDTMWILGDVCDRGNQNISLLLEIMAHPNMHLIMGNHDVWLSRYAQTLIDAKKHPESTLSTDDFLTWMYYNGGFKTADEFMDCEDHVCYDIKLYLEKIPYYEYVQVKTEKFLFVHAGLGSYCRPDARMTAVPTNELIWSHIELNDNPFNDVTMVVGHVPTFLRGAGYENKIIHGDKKRIHHIDCGCVYGRSLGCMRLDDMAEFYVPSGYPYLQTSD